MSTNNTKATEVEDYINTEVDRMKEVMEKQVQNLEWDIKYHKDKILVAEVLLKSLKDALDKLTLNYSDWPHE